MKKYTKLALATTLAMLFSGCGPGGINPTSTIALSQKDGDFSGKLVDSPVEGVKYICGDSEGFTDENGIFKCKELPVKFMVGSIKLGEIKALPEDKIVTPQDLVGVKRDDINNSQVCNIAIFLQSLDDDGLIDDSITIDDEVVENLKEINESIDIKELQEDKIKDILEEAGVGFIIPKDKAISHLKRHLEKIKDMRTFQGLYTNQSDDNQLVESGFGDAQKDDDRENSEDKKPQTAKDNQQNRFNPINNAPDSKQNKKESNSKQNRTDKTDSQNRSSNQNHQNSKKYFIVDDYRGIATDRETKIIWQNSGIGHGTREEAIKFCQKLSLGGINSWRLPTSEESARFHKYMNEQGDTPKQAFSRCTAEVTKDGYVRTKRGAETYGGEPGDIINFRGGANIRCVTGGDTSEDDEDSSDNIKESPSTTNSTASNVNVPPISEELKRDFLEAMNEARAKGRRCGEFGYFKAVPPLKWNGRLYIAAYRHSYDMAKTNTFSHTGSGKKTDLAAQAYHPGSGSSMKERINYAEYKNWRKIGENIAAGTSMDRAREAVDAWIHSPEHCKNLMSPDFTEVGLSVVYDSNSHYKYYWTQDFGRRK